LVKFLTGIFGLGWWNWWGGLGVKAWGLKGQAGKRETLTRRGRGLKKGNGQGLFTLKVFNPFLRKGQLSRGARPKGWGFTIAAHLWGKGMDFLPETFHGGLDYLVRGGSWTYS